MTCLEPKHAAATTPSGLRVDRVVLDLLVGLYRRVQELGDAAVEAHALGLAELGLVELFGDAFRRARVDQPVGAMSAAIRSDGLGLVPPEDVRSRLHLCLDGGH